MTDLKDDQAEKPKLQTKIIDKNRNTSPSWMQPKRLQLTMIFCFIVTMFYMAIVQIGHKSYVAANDELLEGYNNLNVGENLENANNHQFSSEQFRNIGSGRILESINRCEEDLCHITCENVSDIYAALQNTIKDSFCPSIDVLVLKNQNFPWGILKNNWLPFMITIKEVLINISNINIIESNVFNSTLFKDTSTLSLNNMNITVMENGALLGLPQLKCFTFRSHLEKFEPAVLQPVQTTLTNLTLNAHLKINGNINLFGTSYLNNLLYLDLSQNTFNGSLRKKLFESTPNLKYLIISESQIQHIEENAFENVAHKLIFVNLSKNRLSTLAAAVFQPFFVGHNDTKLLKLEENNWICDCQLEEFVNLYTIYRLSFSGVLNCKNPDHLYGASLDEVNFRQEKCLVSSSNVNNPVEKEELLTFTQSRSSTDATTLNSNMFNIIEEPSSNMLKMCCIDSQVGSSEEVAPEMEEPNVTVLKGNEYNLSVPPPTYDFELTLITETNKVIVNVDNATDAFVIWFSDQLEATVISYGDMSLDYECMRYAKPELTVGPLQDNTTYTFCLLSSLKNAISPFNCLPLYVPAKSHDNIWISEDHKDFTIGILCLIFLLSIVSGALIAYFVIKAFPDLLEGSKNVVVVKKSKQPYYVATVSETVYQKQASCKVKKPCTRQQTFNKLTLPKTPSPEISSIPYCMSVHDLETLSVVKPSSTHFEDVVPVCYDFADDEYETPQVCGNKYPIEQHNSVPNTYCTTPRSPPPLPKRNSNASTSSTLVLNRLSNDTAQQ